MKRALRLYIQADKDKNPRILTIIPGVQDEEDLKELAQNPPSYTELLQLEDKIRDLRLKGVPSIERANVPNLMISLENITFPTIGSNLSRISDIEGIDRTRTYTNNIIEIYNYLGIEATEQDIVNELQATLDGARLEVDVRHLLMYRCNDKRRRSEGNWTTRCVRNQALNLSRAAFEGYCEPSA